MRWRAPNGEEISPGEFIPIAEETGLIHKLGRWVLTEACRSASAWPDLGLSAPTVWVNVSSPSFASLTSSSSSSRCSDVRARGAAASAWRSPRASSIEDTESILATTRRSSTMRASSSALDDFGTGYSSLGYLQRLPIDSIKIDRRFVSGLSMAEHENPVPATITDLAHRLAIDVVGEGVETIVQQRRPRAARMRSRSGVAVRSSWVSRAGDQRPARPRSGRSRPPRGPIVDHLGRERRGGNDAPAKSDLRHRAPQPRHRLDRLGDRLRRAQAADRPRQRVRAGSARRGQRPDPVGPRAQRRPPSPTSWPTSCSASAT